MDFIERYNRYIGVEDFENLISLGNKYRIGDKAEIILDLNQELSAYTDIEVDIYTNNTLIESFSFSGETISISGSTIIFDLNTSIYSVGDIVLNVKLIASNIYDKKIVIILGEMYP